MPSLTHKAKVKIAKRLRTLDELIQRKPIFETAGWERRKKRLARKVKKIEATRKSHKAESED
jgi:hypothetical protein